MRNVNIPSVQERLISTFKSVIDQSNTTILLSLAFDSSQMIWWISANANQFRFVFVSLAIAGAGE